MMQLYASPIEIYIIVAFIGDATSNAERGIDQLTQKNMYLLAPLLIFDGLK